MATINMGGFKTAAKKSAAKDEKPFLPDPSGTLVPLVLQAIENKKTLVATEAAIERVKDTLAPLAFAYATKLYAGRNASELSFQLGTAEGKAVISVKNSYKVPADLDPIKHTLGLHAGVLQESFEIKIKSDQIPVHVVQLFVDELVKLARGMDEMLETPAGTDGPVFSAITVKPVVQVESTFHERRFALLSPEANAQLQRQMPCVIALRLDY